MHENEMMIGIEVLVSQAVMSGALDPILDAGRRIERSSFAISTAPQLSSRAQRETSSSPIPSPLWGGLPTAPPLDRKVYTPVRRALACVGDLRSDSWLGRETGHSFRLTNKRLGLNVNFHEPRLVDGVKRIVNNLE